MKRLNHKIILALAVLVLLVFMFWPSPERGPRHTGVTLVPWEVQQTAAGHIQVMGVEIGASTLDDARKVLGSHGEVALFEDQDGLTAEGFFSEFTSGGLSGRIYVALDLPRDRLRQMADRATKREPTETGSIKMRPHWQDQGSLGASVIKSLTYIPYVDLDDEVIRSRFGEPERTLKVGGQRVHYLYPHKGLDLLLDPQGKEVVQYVNPAQFSALIAPLKEDKAE